MTCCYDGSVEHMTDADDDAVKVITESQLCGFFLSADIRYVSFKCPCLLPFRSLYLSAPHHWSELREVWTRLLWLRTGRNTWWLPATCPCPDNGECMEMLNGDVACINCQSEGYTGQLSIIIIIVELIWTRILFSPLIVSTDISLRLLLSLIFC